MKNKVLVALTVLLVASAGFTAGLTKLRRATARWLCAGTFASLGVLVQIPAVSRLMNLRPLHGTDWALVAVAFVVTGMVTLGLASHLKGRPGRPAGRL